MSCNVSPYLWPCALCVGRGEKERERERKGERRGEDTQREREREMRKLLIRVFFFWQGSHSSRGTNYNVGSLPSWLEDWWQVYMRCLGRWAPCKFLLNWFLSLWHRLGSHAQPTRNLGADSSEPWLEFIKGSLSADKSFPVAEFPVESPQFFFLSPVCKRSCFWGCC